MVALIFWFLAASLCWWVFAGTEVPPVAVGLLLAWLYARGLGGRSSRRFALFLSRLIALLPRAYGQGLRLLLRGDVVVRHYTEDLSGADETLLLERIYLVTLTPDDVALGWDGKKRLHVHGLEISP